LDLKTKVIANVVRRSVNDEGQLELTIGSDNPMYEVYLRGLSKNEEYAVTFDTVKRARSLNQNSMLWGLIEEIVQSPNAQSSDKWEMYCHLLARSRAKYTYISIVDDGLEDFKLAHGVRAVQVVGNETRENGKKFINCLVFLGSSQMTTAEMTKLIETTLDYAHKLGIDTRATEEQYR
jgi:hypothetical protein